MYTGIFLFKKNIYSSMIIDFYYLVPSSDILCMKSFLEEREIYERSRL